MSIGLLNITPSSDTSFPVVYNSHTDQSRKNLNKVLKVASIALKGLPVLSAIAAAGLITCGIVPPILSISFFIISGAGIGVLGTALVISYATGPKLIHVIQPQQRSSSHPSTTVKAMPLRDTVESFQWKMRFIDHAQKDIVISGNYCGGHSFDLLLEKIANKLRDNEAIKVAILSSTKFFTDSNRQKLSRLQEQYKNRFSLVPTDDVWTINPGLKKVTNHTKALSIDGGKYFILGGSGLEDKYALAKGIGDLTQGQNSKVQDDSPSSEGMRGGLLDLCLPRGFRDMDFVFESQDNQEEVPAGQILHFEVLKLAALWEAINRCSDKSTSETRVVQELLNNKTSIGSIFIPEFHAANTSSTGKMELFSTGPDMQTSPFLEAIIKRVNQAKERIYIDHMYFHPTKELRQALIDAANRGVKIVLVTTGYDKDFSPWTHRIFGPRNRSNYTRIWEATDVEKQKNIEIYEYGQKYKNTPKQTTLHKKVVVVDDAVLAGSSNLGTKSLRFMSDYEINFSLESKKFADETISVIQDDYQTIKTEAHDENDQPIKNSDGTALSLPLSRRIQPAPLSWSARIAATRHSLLAFLIG